MVLKSKRFENHYYFFSYNLFNQTFRSIFLDNWRYRFATLKLYSSHTVCLALSYSIWITKQVPGLQALQNILLACSEEKQQTLQGLSAPLLH